MNQKYIDDHHIVARYLADQLAEPEREAFEAYLIENPAVVRDLETVARMKVGLMQLRDSGRLGELVRNQPWYRRAHVLAMAASAACLALGFVLWTIRGPAFQPLLAHSQAAITDRLGRPLSIASSHQVIGTRSQEDVHIELPEDPATIELTVIPRDAAAQYDVVLQLPAEAANESAHVRVSGMTPLADGSVRLFVNTARLRPGLYRLILSATGPLPGNSGIRQPGDVFLIRFYRHGTV